MTVGTIADWLVAVGTLVLAAVAIFQETIRGWFYRPAFQVSIKTEPPDCVAVPFGPLPNGMMIDAFYLRLWIENTGNATAKNAEVYADELRRQRLDGTSEPVRSFPPMNLKWANIGVIYFPAIAPKMGKHCDLGHITDPARRQLLSGDVPRLGLTNQQTSLAFDLMVAPNHKGHIVGPGEYQLDIRVAAENALPVKRTITISLQGTWYPDETTMLRDGVGATVLP
jgi:hypothetical protein